MSELSSDLLQAKRSFDLLGKQDDTDITSSKKSRQAEEQLLLFPSSNHQDNNYNSNKFHSVHLDVLRALYDTNGNDNSDDDGVEPELWEQMDHYLLQRHQLKANATVTNASKALTEEAERVIKNQEYNECDSTYPARDLLPAASANLVVISSQTTSPRYHHSNAGVPSSQRTLPGTSFSQPNHERGLNVVNMLLHRKYQTSLTKLQQQTEPVRPIRVAAEKRIQKLEQLDQQAWEKQQSKTQNAIQAILQSQLQSSSLENHAEGQPEDVMLRIAMKLRLWKLLLQDLQANMST
jgi:hypothetical protein